jgi:ERCC4-type nuclease
VLAERGGTQLKVPRPVLLVDTREQNPLDCSRFVGWFAGTEKKALKLGDYSIAGLEDLCVVERKDLPDLVHSFTVERFGVRKSTAADGPLSPQVVGDHRLPQRGEISLCPLGH